MGTCPAQSVECVTLDLRVVGLSPVLQIKSSKKKFCIYLSEIALKYTPILSLFAFGIKVDLFYVT